MGFYIRKALRVGPVRFNLSRSGLGMSVGVRGFRLGTGPRGNYIHMGRGGLYFRQALPASLSRRIVSTPPPALLPTDVVTTVEQMREIESDSVLQMTDSSAESLLNEFNEKRRALRLAPLALLTGLVAVAAGLYFGAQAWTVGVVATVVAVVSILLHIRDTIRKTVVLFYEFDPAAQDNYERLHAAIGSLASSARIWHVAAQGRVRDRKYHAGASSVLSRNAIAPRIGGHPSFRCNVDIPIIPVGRQVLAFMPERLLVFESTQVGAVAYGDLRIDISETRFIEDGAIPSDSQKVGSTWRYVNKKGGPDRRFKDNRELPILLYDEVHFTSSKGLNEILHTSQNGAASALREAIAMIRAGGTT